MKISWNAKGDTVSTVIMWSGGLLAVLVAVAWLARSINDDHVTLEVVDNELTVLQGVFSSACNAEHYWYRHNPKLDNGVFIINGTNICVSGGKCRGNETHCIWPVTSCRVIVCDTGLNTGISLKNITYLVIKNDGAFDVSVQ